MYKSKRVLAFLVSAVMFLPLLLGVGENPFYNKKLPWGFEPPAQDETIFSGKSVSVSNADLKSNESGFTQNSNGFVHDITNWTTSSNTTQVITGAINVNRFQNFKNVEIKNGLTYFDNPPSSRENPYVFLMGNNFDKNTASYASMTSGEITLDANNYYVISVDYYAVGGEGSFQLVPTEDSKLDDGFVPYINLSQLEWEEDVEDKDGDGVGLGTTHKEIANKSEWGTAQFFVKTDILTSFKASLRMTLGTVFATTDGARLEIPSTGVVYFQNPRVLQTSRATYDSLKLASASDSTAFTADVILDNNDKDTALVDINRKAKGKSMTTESVDEIFNFAPNYIYENMPSGSFPTGSYAGGNVWLADVPTILNFESRNFCYGTGREGASLPYLIYAKDGKASLKLVDPFIIRKHQIYLISFYTLGDGVGTMRIVDSRKPKPWEMKNTTIDLSIENLFDSEYKTISIDGKEHTNGWALQTFLVSGNTFNDVEANIEFWIGTEEADASGYLLFDGFNIQRVSSEYFTNHSSTNNINLATNTATSPLANAFFDLGTPNTIESPYPLKPSDWVIEKGNEDLTKSGIVNTEHSHWNTYANDAVTGTSNYGHYIAMPSAIGGKSANNNVLMIQNLGRTWQEMTTKAITLVSGQVNVFSFDLIRQYEDNINFWVTATVKGKEVARLDLTAHDGPKSTAWETKSIALKESEVTNREVVLSFHLGSKDDAWGLSDASTVFIDNFTMTQKSEKPSGAVYVDLTDTRGSFSSETEGLNVLFDKNADVLMLSNTYGAGVARAKSTLTETLEANEFYEYRVRVYVAEGVQKFLLDPIITSAKKPEDYTIEYPEEDYIYGVSFKIDGFEGGFENIKYDDTQKMKGLDDDGYAELVFYIRPDESKELSLVVEFGNENYSYVSDVFIKNISLKKIDEDTFIENKTVYDENKEAYDKETAKKESKQDKAEIARLYGEFGHMTFITQTYVPPEKDDDTAEKAKNNFWQNWWLVVPSFITALAVLFALVAWFIRKFQFRRHIDKKHTSYASDDRTQRRMK